MKYSPNASLFSRVRQLAETRLSSDLQRDSSACNNEWSFARATSDCSGVGPGGMELADGSEGSGTLGAVKAKLVDGGRSRQGEGPASVDKLLSRTGAPELSGPNSSVRSTGGPCWTESRSSAWTSSWTYKNLNNNFYFMFRNFMSRTSPGAND